MPGNQQLVLGMALQDSARFDNFLAGDNRELVTQLEALADRQETQQLFCSAGPGLGKTHLLQAVCQRVAQAGRSAIFIPLDQHATLSPSLLEGLENMQVLCLDNVDRIAGNRAWEQALFGCYNALRERRGCMVFSARKLPAQLPFTLADLRSRLEWGAVYQLQPLTDAQRLQALQLRASGRGFDLPEATGQYLMKRVPRDMTALFGLLERLDEASLSAQHKLTIPFVKTILLERF